MKRVIFSLYVDVPEKEHYGPSKFKHDTIDKALKTRNAFKEHYDKLVQTKQKYSDTIGVPFKLYEYDEQFKAFEKNLLNDFPFFTGYEVINFYKIHLLYELAKDYDEILYLDFDAIPVTNESFFNNWDLSKGICVYNNNAMINKNNRAIDKMTHGIRSPSAKYFNTQAMLIATDNSPINDVINTGIVGATKTDLLKLDFFGKFYDTITLMTKLREEGLDGLYPQNVIDMFRYDNETIFSYKIQVNNINIQWLDNQWHYFFDTQFFIPKETKIVHTINKDFDTVWRFYEKHNL
tara:strand:- start:3020 stop:3895 length:876 start_codon:yes stop_codon:yes gene_type:complete